MTDRAVGSIILTVVLTAVVLAPLWAFPFIATQDGPSHLYNTSILLRWDEPGSPFPQVFERDLTPGPNWLGTAALYALMRVADPLTAERLLLSLYVAAMAAAWWWWAAGFGRPAGPLAALGPLLAMSFFLFKGFYGFCLSVPLFLCTVAAAWRWRAAAITPLRAAVLNGLLAVTWLAHMVSFGAALLGAASILSLAAPGGAPARARAGRALWLSPALMLGASALATASAPSSGRRWGWGRIAAYVLRAEWIVYLEGAQLAVGAGLILLLAGAWVVGRLDRGRAAAAPPGGWQALVAAAAGILALCFALPRTVGGGDFLTDRLAMFPVLLLAPLAGRPGQAPARVLLAVAVAALTIAQASLTWSHQRRSNADLAEYLALGDAIAPGSVVLPLSWDLPPRARVSPLRHAACHSTRRAGAVNLANYEAATGHFQIRYRDPVERAARVPILPPLALVERDPSSLDVRPLAGSVDYLITWSMRGGAPHGLIEAYQEAWEVAAEKGRVILFRPRRP